ncbi:hypothetical protein [Reinekea sp. G2M2-21]|uniref:hypothetical protein n=1 Tax=Reinekea sp. G2M2-21 TaxID=2788942 RepID=UPI0018A8B564|nr:hypothetical protein [Reinekea sp. G2M2-21]
MILTKNNVSVGTTEHCPYLTLSEALYLVENQHMQSNQLESAIFGGALFCFPLSLESAIPENLDDVEARIRARRKGSHINQRSLCCYDVKNPESVSCKSCNSRGNVVIVGVRNNDDFVETIVRCPNCGERSTLDVDQAHNLTESLFDVLTQLHGEHHARTLLASVIDYVAPAKEFAEEWEPLRNVLAPLLETA